MSSIECPLKTREMQNHHIDSECWNNFPFRDDDIVIGTYLKSGTTWMQQIVGQILFEGPDELDIHELSPWIDQRLPGPEDTQEMVEAQTYRRFLKTHLPVDALEFSPKAKYIYVARDGRDMAWSLHNHHANANELYYKWINRMPGRVGPILEKPPEDPREYFLTWLEKDGYPFWSYWNHIRSWWNVRQLPNVRVLHYNNLKADLAGEIRGIMVFLDVSSDDESIDRIVEHCTFDWMKKHSQKATPFDGAVWKGGGDSFINKGTNGRWKDALTAEDVDRYEQTSIEQLGSECAAWLATGQMPGGNT